MDYTWLLYWSDQDYLDRSSEATKSRELRGCDSDQG